MANKKKVKQYVCPNCLNKFDFGDYWFQCAKFTEESEKIHGDNPDDYGNPKKIREINPKVKDKELASKSSKADSAYCAKIRKDMGYAEQEKCDRNIIADDCVQGNFKCLTKVKGNEIPQSAPCYYCKEEATQHICPNCKKPINIDKNADQFIINLAGAKSSGKSDFLGSVLFMIKEKFSEVTNSWRIKFDRHANEYYNSFKERVVSGVGDGTKPGEKNDPAIVTFEKTMGDYVKSYSFIFYDIAGELLTNDYSVRERARKAEKFSRPDLIIYLCDPARMNGPYNDVINSKNKNLSTFAKEFLIDTEHLDSRDDNEKNHEYIAKIRDFLRDISIFKHGESPKEANKQADIPVAVCVTMLDVLKEVYTEKQLDKRQYFKNSKYLETRKVKEYAEEQLNEKSDNMKLQLRAWGEDNFVNYLNNNFGEIKYFGISSLGAADSDLENIDMRKDFKPINVLDPLVWFINLVAGDIYEGNTQPPVFNDDDDDEEFDSFDNDLIDDDIDLMDEID